MQTSTADNIEIKQLPKTLFRFIAEFVKEQKYSFIAIQLLAFGWSMDNTLWPYALKLLIDKFTHYTPADGNIWQYLLPVLLLWMGIWVTIEIMFRLQGFIMAYAFPKLEAKVRMCMFAYVQRHSYDFFANNFAGNLSNKISDMTGSITRLLQLIITLFVPASMTFIIGLAIFTHVNYHFALQVFAWVVIHMGICIYCGRRCAELSEQHSSVRSMLAGKIVDSFTNVINVKLFTRARFEQEYVMQAQQQERSKQTTTLVYIEKMKIALGIISIIFPGVIGTWLLVYAWQHQWIGIGDVVLIFNVTWNLTMLAWYAGLEMPNLYKEIGVCEQALAIIKAPHEIVEHENARDFKASVGQIKFTDVCFHYDNKKVVFNKLNVSIAGGEKVGLVGFTGSGKTTFVNLIMRFFDVTSGDIVIDGCKIHEATLNSLRSEISMIPQAPSLFHRSLMENIRYGKLDATDEEVYRASKLANCHEFISSLTDGYQALVGERGIKLSGGQRQRIAIARAILKDAPILILDEATSALDSVTERAIQDALSHLMDSRTTIVIAHRLSTLAEMDRVLVFNEGNIIEEGTHDSLLKENGHYAKMWHMQAGGFMPDTPC